jgi:tetratricopeptide (TPR) repeat protein
MMPRLRVQGLREDTAYLREPLSRDFNEIIGASLKDAIRLDASRSTATTLVTDELRNDDVIEVELEGGLKLWFAAADADKELGAIHSRSGGSDVIEVPAVLPRKTAQRGIGSWIIKAVRIFEVKDSLASLTAAQVAAKLEAQVVPAPGLFRWGIDGHLQGPADPTQLAGSQPILVYLHGTASSTLGSFGALPGRDSSWRRLVDVYSGRILALEHHTLSVSPLANAIDCLEALPSDATLHLVSHSRGGLIGELLCRGQLLDRSSSFDDVERKLFTDTSQVDLVNHLDQLLRAKQPKVERFVRVACPARGTTLAGERLDRWLSLLANLIQLTPGLAGSPIYELVKSFLLAVVKKRADPRTIPGLEAMIPDSPFQRLINRPGVVAKADLTIIKGDMEGAGILGRLKALATDLFYREDHDLVVNTSAMDGGVSRDRQIRMLFDQGPDVDHFSYFRNQRTVDALLRGLVRKEGDDTAAGFALIDPAAPLKTVPRSPVKTRSGEQPIVFVLPGITGSQLRVGGDDIWIDIPDLAFGGLRKLDIGARNIEAYGLLGRYYGELVAYLSNTHEVLPFPYDWRLSIRDEADRFAHELENRLSASRQRIGIVAHSMGGLIARAAFLTNPDLWRIFRQRRGRLVMLGTPTDGSYGIPLMLMGRDETMQMLALLDITMSASEHLALVSRFPGVLDLLPRDRTLDFYTGDTWDRLRRNDIASNGLGIAWPLPAPDDLRTAFTFRQTLDSAPFDAEHMLYIAGQGITVDGIRVDDGLRRIEFTRTHEGDGRVLWRTGILPGMRAWFTDCAHGDLARHKPAFGAILDLLERGTTTRLPTRPTLPRDLAAPEPILRERVEVFPDAADLAAAGLGAREKGETAAPLPPIRIRVVHGNLGFARFPLIVGHYEGDTLAGAEAHLDRALGGRLRRRRNLNLYPGAIGTADVVLDQTNPRRGAIVVGLGDVGRLTAGGLRRALLQGLRQYAAIKLDVAGASGQSSIEPIRTERACSLQVSALLVGTGTGGVSLATGIGALLQALREAQASLPAPGYDVIELVELYEHRAIQTWHEVSRLIDRPELVGTFELDGDLKRGEGGRRRVAEIDDRSWWQPMTVVMDQAIGPGKVMSFIVPTGTARAEAAVLPAHKTFVDTFIAQATGGADSMDPNLGTPGRALFELLIPHHLKDQLREDRPLRLVLDQDTAAYPWELLDDRRPWPDTGGSGAGIAGGHQDPPAVRAGLVRQLIRQSFRERPARGFQRGKAIVIGNPLTDPGSGFPSLPHAAEEAELVADLLVVNGYDVTRFIEEPSAEAIVSALCAQDWQVIHIAAHGIIGKASEPTGVVLGGGLVLTADMLGQLLPLTPDLVFLNCCHLAALPRDGIEPAARSGGPIDPNAWAHRPRLAANLAVKLIENGVGAVVAAGWAIDDAGAKTFAQTLYERLLDTRKPATLGDASRDARRSTYRNVGGTTWGAYQVYGEPDWRLNPIKESSAAAEEKSFASRVELVDAVDQIIQDAQTGVVRDLDAQKNHLASLAVLAEDRKWMSDAVLVTAIGQAYGELGDLSAALTFYRKALRCDPAHSPLRTLEQYANLTVRHSVAEWRKDRNTAKWAASCEEMVKLIESLDQVVGLTGDHNVASPLACDSKATAAYGTSTGERQALRGACFKRWAQIDADQRDHLLQHMADAYERSDNLWRVDTGRVNPYPILMHVSAVVARNLRSPGRRSNIPEKTMLRLAEAETTASERDLEEPNFWDALALGDVKLLRGLAYGDLKKTEIDAIASTYDSAWQRGGSILKLNSVFEQIDFLIDVLSDPTLTGASRTRVKTALAGLADLRAGLEARTRPLSEAIQSSGFNL